jgi:alpha-amylase
VDEGTGLTYGFHGYWAKDWTAFEPNYGTEQEFAELVEEAHSKGIRILMDVVINHTGPVTPMDQVWPSDWVRTSPQCKYQDYESTVTCTLVENLPDVLTESTTEVELPKHLTEKWAAEGRLEKEVDELNAFFEATGYPRTPRFYIIKWLTDYIRKYGIDGYRIDTVKHTEEDVWGDLWKEAFKAFEEWKKANPDKVLDTNDFFMVGEVYGYGISGERLYDYGDRKVDYFAQGMKSLINFDFKGDANKDYEELFSTYSKSLNGPLKGLSVMNYVTSHDDGHPFDKERKRAFEAATKLLLSPGSSQVYYGDESARNLIVEGAVGDATLRTFMNWDDLQNNKTVNGVELKALHNHYKKLGQFRINHPSVGAGVHTMVQEKPYYFKREYYSGEYSDKVIIGLDLEAGLKSVPVKGVFDDGVVLTDFYSGKSSKVKNGVIELESEHRFILLSE